MSKVYLVGAGPGDPELITLKGRRALERADVVFFDHLANVALLDLAPPGAERIYVGKKRADHALSQPEICEALIERARRGQCVVRLKGGDPFIFGRGGEEAEALAEAGLEFEIVPGVTTPLGIAAYTGVPLTHRKHSSAVTFISGHDVAGIDWAHAAAADTLVVFMGLTAFPQIAHALIAQGRGADTPAIAVRWATRPSQQTVAGTLGDLPGLVAAAGMKPPATFIVGEVARLHSKLDWYGRLPLSGKRIVVTRAKGQADALASRLRDLGADAIEMPAIEIRPSEDYVPLDRAIAELRTYDWLIFTSANGVRFFLDRLDRSATDLRALRARICAIGPATRAAVEALHLKVDLMGREYVAEGLLAALAPFDLSGKRVLLPRAAVARDLVPVELVKRGARVDVVEAYRTVAPEGAAEQARALFCSGAKPDYITFTSASTVRNVFDITGAEALRGVKAISIGPVTSGAARDLGIEIAAEASVFTIDGVVEAALRIRELERTPNPSA